MIGINLEELYDFLENNHEVEFEYENENYVIQPEVKDNDVFLVIWDCTSGKEKCIVRHLISSDGTILKKDIDIVLSVKCFKERSFFEIEDKVEVIMIY